MENDRKGSRGDEERYDLEILLRRPSLRTNISRRVSQACREAVPMEGTTCGVGCLRGQWLQSFANRNSYIFIYGILGSYYGSYYAYFYGAVSTLEKRFKMSSQTVGIIASAGDITQAITCFILSFCAPKAHRPQVIGVGVLLIVASTIAFALPHFLIRPEKIFGISTRDYSSYLKNETDSSHCQENPTCNTNPEVETGYVFLILSQVLHGIGGGLYHIAGKSYKNENVDKHQPPALLSLLTVLTILGPAFGYWLSSMLLKIFEYPDLMPHITEEEPQWLGAWWLGSLVIGFMFLIPGFLISLFPTNLPKAAARKRLNVMTEIKRNSAEERGQHVRRFGWTITLKKFLVNPAFNCTHFAAVFNIMGFITYFIFLPKYVETQYRISASNANLIAGSITLISSAAGIVSANSVITRYRPSARILSTWTVIVGILSMGGLISYIYLGCQAIDDEVTTMINQDSNTTCKCSNSPFFPVCDEHRRSFTTPCQAGCGNILYINYIQGYEICNTTLASRKVYTGFCPLDCHSEFLKFIIMTCMMSFVYATGRTSYYWFEANYEENQGKHLVLSSGMNFLGLLASIPAPIVFGYLLDESCLLWEGKCHKAGNCWLYDNKSLRLSMNLSAVGYALIGIIYDLCVWYSVKNLELFDDNDYNTDESDEK